MTRSTARQPFVWLLLLSFAFAVLSPNRPASASEPFKFLRLTAYFGTQAYSVTDGIAINRNVDRFVVSFNHDLNFETTAYQLIWTDSTGAPAQIGQEISYGSESNQTVRAPLKANETYTLTIKGGDGGVKDAQGNTLPQEITVRFKTDGSPLITTVNPITGWDRYGIRQTDGYVFRAAKGRITIKMNPAEDEQYLVAVGGPSPEQIVWKGTLTPERPEAAVELPQAGAYYLAVGPVNVSDPYPMRSIQVTGPDLEMDELTTPPLQAKEMALFEAHDTSFDLDVAIQSPTEPAGNSRAEAVRVILDDEILSENILGPDSRTGRITIDPATLSDGAHRLTVQARSFGSENESTVVRTFFVDRVDAFSDVPKSHWARRPVEFMHDLGILNGQGNGLFAPGQPVTRAAFAKMLALTVWLPEPKSTAEFADVPDAHWGKPYLQKLAAAGLLKGETVGGATFMHPDRTITRAEAVTLMGRVIGIAETDLAEAGLDPAAYQIPDLEAIPSWAKPSVLILRHEGWVTGFPDGRFGPSETLGRDQAAKLLSRFLGL